MQGAADLVERCGAWSDLQRPFKRRVRLVNLLRFSMRDALIEAGLKQPGLKRRGRGVLACRFGWAMPGTQDRAEVAVRQCKSWIHGDRAAKCRIGIIKPAQKQKPVSKIAEQRRFGRSFGHPLELCHTRFDSIRALEKESSKRRSRPQIVRSNRHRALKPTGSFGKFSRMPRDRGKQMQRIKVRRLLLDNVSTDQLGAGKIAALNAASRGVKLRANERLACGRG